MDWSCWKEDTSRKFSVDICFLHSIAIIVEIKSSKDNKLTTKKGSRSFLKFAFNSEMVLRSIIRDFEKKL